MRALSCAALAIVLPALGIVGCSGQGFSDLFAEAGGGTAKSGSAPESDPRDDSSGSSLTAGGAANAGGADAQANGGTVASGGASVGAGAPSAGGDAGSGGAPNGGSVTANGSAGGDDGGPAGSGGTTNTGGTPSNSGGLVATGGDTTGCSNPLIWFPDADGDGYGTTVTAVRSCDKPEGKWATAGGDCVDTNPRVYPAQRSYFAQPYDAPTGESSFDYDCNGYESSDPIAPGAAKECSLLSAVDCGGAGYAPTGRTGGPGVNALCGSTTVIACEPNTLGLLCIEVTKTGQPPHLCR